MDDVMGQAQEVAFNLREQRQLFSNIGDKLLSVAAKYPAVNGLLNAIRRKRSKVIMLTTPVMRSAHASTSQNYVLCHGSTEV
jgi:golgi SNAP receptor complex member 1